MKHSSERQVFVSVDHIKIERWSVRVCGKARARGPLPSEYGHGRREFTGEGLPHLNVNVLKDKLSEPSVRESQRPRTI